MNQNKWKKYLQGPLLMYVVLVIVIMFMVNALGTTPRDTVTEINYSQLLNMIEKDQISHIMLAGNTLVARSTTSKIPADQFGSTRYDLITDNLNSDRFYNDVDVIYAEKLGVDVGAVSSRDYKFEIVYQKPVPAAWWVDWLPLLVSMLLMAGLWYFLMRQQSGGGKGVMSFGKSKARLTDPSKNKVTFRDVAGAEEEKEELREIVEFLKDPKKFTDVGARIPKGVLLVGPPGTGKTLLARAVSGEAAVPFFTISGSDFGEMFVGVGASRERDLFDQAKKAAPSIVFIDEIDAVGRQRGAGLGGGHDEREQTLNQLLVEMDGFTHNEGVIVMAATNRADILDPALLRPGRFDRQITVNYPDILGREEIMKVHARGKPMDPNVDLSTLAKKTPFFTGADIENVLNEAAILTARRNNPTITMDTLEEAITKVQMGTEKKSYRVTPKDKRLVAYHEAGHALVMHYLMEGDKVHEVSIIPRGKGAGGYTLGLPNEEVNYVTKAKLKSQIAMAMGGRVAERMVMGDISTGASSDIKQANQIARGMVTKYGMSDELGPIFLGGEHEVFLGRDFSSHSEYSDEMTSKVDAEVKKLLSEAEVTAEQILTEHRDQLDMIAEVLMKKEKLDTVEFEKLMNGASVDQIMQEAEEAEAKAREQRERVAAERAAQKRAERAERERQEQEAKEALKRAGLTPPKEPGNTGA